MLFFESLIFHSTLPNGFLKTLTFHSTHGRIRKLLFFFTSYVAVFYPFQRIENHFSNICLTSETTGMYKVGLVQK